MSRRLIIRLLLALAAILVLAGAALWLFGPRPVADPTVHFTEGSIGRDPDRYLSEREADVSGVKPETAKEIVWAYPASRARTPLAIVYVHGFSGDRRELSPVPETVARRLGANLYFTRLAGHGRDLAALAEPSANDWLNDFAEAIAIGRRIGERVVVVSTSTGGTLSAWAASLGLTEDVAGFVMISPNFAVADWRARFLTMPFAEDIVPFVTGGGLEFTLAQPTADGSETAVLPAAALLPMAALVEVARHIDFEAIATPALFVYSPRDRVVMPAATEAVVQRWGGPAEVLLVENPEDPLGHMLAGDMFSPGTTGIVVDAVTNWIGALEAR